jgi:hypothetical protein
LFGLASNPVVVGRFQSIVLLLGVFAIAFVLLCPYCANDVAIVKTKHINAHSFQVASVLSHVADDRELFKVHVLGTSSLTDWRPFQTDILLDLTCARLC